MNPLKAIVTRWLIPLAALCVGVFLFFHSTPKLAMTAARGEAPLEAFDPKLNIRESPFGVRTMSAASYHGNGTFYVVSKDGAVGEGYFLVEKFGFLYFARSLGGG